MIHDVDALSEVGKYDCGKKAPAYSEPFFTARESIM